MANPTVVSIFEEMDKTKSRKAKIDILRYHRQNPVLIPMLKLTFDENITWDLPEGSPPYKKQDDLLENDNGLYREWRKLYIFVNTSKKPEMSSVKREKLFIEMLESILPEEAELVIAVKDKKLPYKGITRKLVEEALPGILR